MEKTFKILLLENIHPIASEILRENGFSVDCESTALSESDLCQKITDYHAVGIRSKTKFTEKAIEAGKNLWTVGAFCIGTNQVDLDSANSKGVPVFNAPYSNTRSVAELVIAEMICLARKLGDRSAAAHQGQWMKSADGSHEIRGKTLGIVGYGHIGSQVSVMAEAMGLRVLYYDIVTKLPLGNSRPVDSLGELLKESDFVTFHVPETEQTKNMMGAQQFGQMKRGAYFINASRGTVVQIDALAEAIKSGQVGGAAVDVFPSEPKNNKEEFQSPLCGLGNVILTPHIGGSTEEAQESIGREVAASFIRYFESGSTVGSVNFPVVDPQPDPEDFVLMNVHRNVPGVMGEINSIVSKSGMNIHSQYLATDPQIGYLVMGLEGDRSGHEEVVAQVAALQTSIKTRVG